VNDNVCSQTALLHEKFSQNTPAKLNIVGSLLLSITNKIEHYTIFFIAVNALHVSGGFSAHHQELETVHTSSGICQACLLLPLAWIAVAASKPDTYQMLCVQFSALMMGGKPA
jgi:hypothetical protein